MAAKHKAKAAKKTAEGAWTSRYVQRAIQDPDVRDNARVAYDSARKAYERLNNRKDTSKQLFDDKKLHRELQTAADALRETAFALREGPRRKRRRKGGGLGKLLLLAIVGGGAAIALSEDLRNKVLDALFGAEEEFDYTSTTQPAAPAPTGETATASPNGG